MKRWHVPSCIKTPPPLLIPTCQCALTQGCWPRLQGRHCNNSALLSPHQPQFQFYRKQSQHSRMVKQIKSSSRQGLRQRDLLNSPAFIWLRTPCFDRKVRGSINPLEIDEVEERGFLYISSFRSHFAVRNFVGFIHFLWLHFKAINLSFYSVGNCIKGFRHKEMSYFDCPPLPFSAPMSGNYNYAASGSKNNNRKSPDFSEQFGWPRTAQLFLKVFVSDNFQLWLGLHCAEVFYACLEFTCNWYQ